MDTTTAPPPAATTSSTSPQTVVISEKGDGVHTDAVPGPGHDPKPGAGRRHARTLSDGQIPSQHEPQQRSGMPLQDQPSRSAMQYAPQMQLHQYSRAPAPPRPQPTLRTAYSDDAQEHQNSSRRLPQAADHADSKSRPGYRRHRKSHSSNAATFHDGSGAGGYGSFWGPAEGTANPQLQYQQIQYTGSLPVYLPFPMGMPPTGPQHHVRRGSWGDPSSAAASILLPPQPAVPRASSPRSGLAKSLDPRVNEMRSLTATLGSGSPRASPRVSSPAYRAASVGVPHLLLPAPAWPPTPSATGGGGAPTDRRALDDPAGNGGSLNSRTGRRYALPSPGGSNASPDDLPGGGSGSLNSRSGRRYSDMIVHKRLKAESVRRKHMRQHSAQIYMEDAKGVQQPLVCRDVAFLLLFLAHLLAVVYLGNMYFDYGIFAKGGSAVGGLLSEAVRSSHHQHHHYAADVEVAGHAAGAAATTPIAVDDEDTVVIHYDNLLYTASLCGAFAMSLSAILLGIMTLFARYVVQVALGVVITLSFIWGTIGIGLSPRNFVPITGIIALALSVAYAFIVWDRIPFASANVLTALTAVRTYPGLTLLALLFQALALAWSIYFCVVVVGVYDAIQEEKLIIAKSWTIALYTALGVSYYWTYQVLSNTLKACTASVVGSWWHAAADDRIVSKAVFKIVFYSLGSICYGSLFVEPVGIIRQMAILFRSNAADDTTLMCFHECLRLFTGCITSAVDALAHRYNHWAFTYIGLYNYSFSDAAGHATELFEKRGWTTIVSDDLVPNILLITSLVLGGMTGCFGHVLEWIDLLQISSLDEPGLVSFVIGTVIGVVLSSILFGIIHSAVNTVLVCFAAEPVDFQENHPQLSDEMRVSWREVWPDALDVLDMRLAVAQARNGVGGPSPNPVVALHPTETHALLALHHPPVPPFPV